MDSEHVLHALKLAIVCLLWYISSASGNIIGKLVLTEFPYPMTVTLVQLISASVYLGPILGVLGVPHTGSVPKRYYFTMIIPLALGKFLSAFSSHVSIWIVSVSYAHTVKATLPLFTVVLSRVLLGETQTLPVYLSLLPIIGGVIIATLTEVSFEFMGLFSALGATLGFSLMTIFSKKCLHETGLHHLRLLVLLCRISALCFFPVWLLFDFRKIISTDTVVEGKSLTTPVLLLFLDGVFSMLQNIFAFTVLAMVTSLSYAVANATKRVVIIGASLVFLQNPVTMINFIGMMIAVFGVLVYNKAKYDQNQAKRREQVLPYVHSDSNLNAHLRHNLSHSKSTSNLRANGYIHPDDHILLQNNIQLDHVTLLPPMKDAKKDRGSFGLSDLHSRGIHHV